MAFEIEIFKGLQKDFDLMIPETFSKEIILEQLKLKISEMLQGNAEIFFQTLYRLDISEQKTNAALLDNEHAIDCLAQLIYERQLQKAISRVENKPKEMPDDVDLKW